MAYDTPDTLKTLRHLFHEPKGTTKVDLLDYYGPTTPPLLDAQPISITIDNLRTCLASAPPLSFPHKDGWRVKYLIPLAADPAYGEALATFMIIIYIQRSYIAEDFQPPLFCDTCDPP